MNGIIFILTMSLFCFFLIESKQGPLDYISSEYVLTPMVKIHLIVLSKENNEQFHSIFENWIPLGLTKTFFHQSTIYLLMIYEQNTSNHRYNDYVIFGHIYAKLQI